MQERRNSIANALELCLSCTNPSIFVSTVNTDGLVLRLQGISSTSVCAHVFPVVHGLALQAVSYIYSGFSKILIKIQIFIQEYAFKNVICLMWAIFVPASIWERLSPWDFHETRNTVDINDCYIDKGAPWRQDNSASHWRRFIQNGP